MKRELEICIDEPESAFAAIAGGADRLEVCAALEVGGLSPPTSLIELLNRETSIPLHVMIRPRAGGFVYSANERELMLRELKGAADLKVAGVVFGALTSAGEVDFEFVDELKRTAGDLHCPNCGREFARERMMSGKPAHKIIQGKVFTRGMRRK